MLRSIKELERCTVGALDGPIGTVQDAYFDDATWVIRYLVVNTGSWLAGRDVLIPPMSIADWQWGSRQVPLTLTKRQVEHSPLTDTDRPVSRQNEESTLGYYGYPFYWGGAGLWGGGMSPAAMMAPVDEGGTSMVERYRHAGENPHLRSCNAVSRYYLHAADGELGHVSGYLVDERSWAIRFLIVNTSNWWLGHEVLVAPEWIESIDWLDSTVTTDLSRDAVKASPVYDAAMPMDAPAESRIYGHYGRRTQSSHAEATRAR